MKAIDSFKLAGELSIYLKYKNKTPELFFKEENLIVNEAKRYLLSSIYLVGVPSDPVTTLRVGRQGTIDPEGLYPKAEDPEQAALSDPSPIILPALNTPDAPNILVSFLADLPNEDTVGNPFNGDLISEAGLFKASGAMFNIKNHPGIQKTEEFSIHYTWIIKIL